MQTKNDLLLDFLGMPNTQFVIPPYQRLYSWKERQCKELWLDLGRAARGDVRHFIGTLLYVKDSEVDGITRLAVVDGQQRLTTLTLVLVALQRYLETHDLVLSDIDAMEIRTRYLKVGNDGKLLLSRDDRETLAAVVDGGELPEKASENVLANLAFFQKLMEDEEFDPEQLWKGLNALFIIDAQSGRDDNAQLIFESLNSKGVPLTTADLVRNYLLLARDHDEQAYLYDEYWSVIQGVFQPDPGSLKLDNAIQGWLTVRFRKVRAKGAGEVYSVFKQYVEDDYDGTIEALLLELRGFCMVWAENYRYHAVKKFKSSMKWAVNGGGTLVAGRKARKVENKQFEKENRKHLDSVDESW